MAVAAESQFHVLAVDDSRIDRLLIERLLKTSSYQVTAVDSGSKALEFLGLSDNVNELISPNTTSSGSPSNHQELGVNLIITDYCMPGMTGYDLLRKIKESAAVKNIPVVIMSSENVPSRISRCLEEGAEEFLLKPVKLADVHRLRPHMLKAKGYTDQEKQGEEEDQEVDSEITEIQIQPQSESNKRKALDIEEIGLSPDRTRTRYKKLAVSS